jgi:hypothetical protein
MRARSLFAVASFLTASWAAGQTVSVGSIPSSPNFGFQPGIATVIDLAAPANGAGILTSATFLWQSAPCPATVKIKFFRPSGQTLIFLTERGPFNVTTLTQIVALSPGVPVQPGDLVGIARIVANCGSPVAQTPGAVAGMVAYSVDVTFNVITTGGQLIPNATLAVQATGPTFPPVPIGAAALVLPVAISGAGLQGSLFRTAVQAYNASSVSATGSFVFHPQGRSGSSNDPSISYTIAPGQTVLFNDLLVAMGTGGVGSVDVLPSAMTQPPILSVRVFQDGGTAGTSGFTEDARKPEDAISAGSRAVLVAPFDTTAFRYNIGVRTLDNGASIAVTLRDQSGTVRATVTRTYGANFFLQTDAAAFLGGVIPGANDSISVDVLSGSLFLYGATADNRTNDPALQEAEKVF